MNDRDDIDTSSDGSTVRPRNITHTFRLIVAAALIVAVVLVAFDNKEDVEVGYVFDEAQAPLWVVLIAAAICGVVIGWLLRLRSRMRN